MKINVEEFLGILTKVKSAVDTKDIIEQATHFIFSGDAIVAYNGSMSIRYPFKTDFKKISVKANDLYKIISTIKEPEVDIFVSAENDNEFCVKGKKTTAGFNTIVDDSDRIYKLLNYISSEISEGQWIDLPDNFIKGIKLCLFSASKDATKPALTCLYFNRDIIQSIDNTRVSRYRMLSEMPEMSIKATSAKDLTAYSVDKVLIGKSWAHFGTSEGLICSIQRMLVNQPDMSDYFDIEEEGFILPISDDDINTMIDSASVMTENEDTDKKISVTVEDAILTIKGKTDRGWVEKELYMPDYNGDDFSFSIHPVFFKQIIGKATEIKVFPSLKRAMFVKDEFSQLLSLVA
jgi:hypothetical protein